MAPKKKGGKKDDPAKFADKENLARAETEVLSLQRLLEVRSQEALEARRSERLWRERVDAFSTALETQKEDTLDITADMLRQYKAMQEQLLKRVNELEQENKSLRVQLDERDEALKKIKADNSSLKKHCDAEVATYQNKMEQMQIEFAQMLRETLDKMHERLEQSHGQVA